MLKITAKKKLTDEKVAKLKGTFLDDSHYDTLIEEDCDVVTPQGQLLIKFRKGVMPMDKLQAGYDGFKGSIEWTEGRGITSGGSGKRVRKDGTKSNITVGNKVQSGNVGYMDRNAMVHYCRRTAFARKYFDKFQQGIPFIEEVDKLYGILAPEHYAKQVEIAKATNQNYLIGDTCFTTVTVNKNFQTAVHRDSGDFAEGFGNLIVYSEGGYSGGYFVLPQYRIAVDLQNTDVLFVDVHQWHGNTSLIPLVEGEDYLRVSFVIYYREKMFHCKAPKDELKYVKEKEGGLITL